MVDTIMRAMREGPDEQHTPTLDWEQMAAGLCFAAVLGLILLAAVIA